MGAPIHAELDDSEKWNTVDDGIAWLKAYIRGGGAKKGTIRAERIKMLDARSDQLRSIGGEAVTEQLAWIDAERKRLG